MKKNYIQKLSSFYDISSKFPKSNFAESAAVCPKRALKFYLLLLAITATSASAQVGIGTTSPAAALDITSSNDGILIPRVSLQSTTSVSVANPTASKLVYNTATVNDVTPGFYYLNPTATAWIRLATGADLSASGDNLGNHSATQALSMNNNLISNASSMGIGTAAPAEKLEIASGNIFMNNNASTGNWIRWAGAAIAPPALGATSIGTRLVLFPGASSGPAFTNYAMGINAGTMWYSVPQANTDHFHKFYGGNSPLMTIRGDGNVGVGTESPTRKFHVNGSLQVTNEINVGGTASAPGSAGSAGQYLRSNGPGAAPTWESPATATPGWALAGNSGTNPTANFLGTIDNQDLSIRTFGSEKIRVTSGGNVGIGTTAPASKFHLQGTAQEIAIFGSSADARYITFGNGASGNGGYMQMQTAAGLFNFGLHGIGNQLVLKNNSNVGIGTADAVEKLTVAGGNIGMDNQRIITAKNTSGVYENVLYGRWADNATYLDGGTGGTSLRTNNGTVVNQYLGTNGNTSFGLPSNTAPTQRIDVGSGNVRIRDINSAASTSTNGTDRVVVADANGVLKTVVPETAIRTINSISNLPITAADETLLVDTQPPLQNVLVILPPATGLKAKKFIVKKIDGSANIVVITSASSIDAWSAGSSTATAPTLNTPYQAFTFQSDGTKWHIIGRY